MFTLKMKMCLLYLDINFFSFFLFRFLRYHFGSFSAVCVILRHISRSAVGWGASRAEFSWTAMLTLASKLKRDDAGKPGRATGAPESTHRVSIRDRLLTKGTAAIAEKIISFWRYQVRSSLFCFGYCLNVYNLHYSHFPKGFYFNIHLLS